MIGMTPPQLLHHQHRRWTGRACVASAMAALLAVFTIAILMWPDGGDGGDPPPTRLAAPPDTSGQKMQVPTLVFGDIRGYFEPCGCNPSTDLGGMKRLGGFIDLLRPNYPALEILSTGNNFHSQQFRTEDQFIQQSLTNIAPTAMLFGLTEWHHQHQLTTAQRASYLLTHRHLKSRGFKSVVHTDHSVIFGLHYDPAQLIPQPDDFAFVRDERQRRQELRSILLLATPYPSEFFAEFAAWLPLFDLILLSHAEPLSTTDITPPTVRPAYALPLYQELQVPIYSSPLAGAALLSMHLRTPLAPAPTSSSPSLPDTLTPFGAPAPAILNLPASPSAPHGLAVQHLWLTSTQPISDAMLPIEAAYRAHKTAEFETEAAAKLEHLTQSAYVGSASCSGCHQSAYEVWQNSAHSSAFATLVQADQHTNALCVSCHVVDLHAPGGYINTTYTPHLKDVGCESCHGPRRDHILKFHDPQLQRPADVAAKNPWDCTTCHHPPHIVDFDVDAWWQRIEHGY